MSHHCRLSLTGIAVLLSCGALIIPQAVFGAGTVTNCTQAELEAALVGGGTVRFGSSGTVTLTNTLIIAEDTLLDASGYAVTISGGNAVRLFRVNTNVKFEVKGLTLADGQFIGANAPDGHPAPSGQDGFGAGILNLAGTVILNSCTLTNHQVRGGNAGRDLVDPTSNTGQGGNALGAAICNLGGSLLLTNCEVGGNVATGGQGSAPPQSPFSGAAGNCGHAFGGAIYSADGRLTLQNVTAMANRAIGGKPLVPPTGVTMGRGGDGIGGALCMTNSVVCIGSSALVSNAALGTGSDNGTGGGVGAGWGLGGALFLSQNSSGKIELSQFSTNVANGGYTSRNVIAGLGLGGAVFNGGSLELLTTTFSGNSCLGSSYSWTAGPGLGGAIYSTNTLSITGSTFDSNTALGGTGIGYMPYSRPGAVAEGGAVWSSGLVNATNSTWVANRAAAGRSGPSVSVGASASGGALCVSGGTAMLVNVTIANNRADGDPDPYMGPGPSQGGGLCNTNGTLTIRNSIVANSTNGGDVYGNINDSGYNLCSDNTAHFSAIGSLNNADPRLAALSYNDGPVPTMSLLVGSPARDAIPSGFPPLDQRGIARPQGPAADIGAVEADFVPGPPTIVTQPKGATVRAGTNVAFNVVASSVSPVSYQWFKGGSALSGATTDSLGLSHVQAADAATYSVVVTNVYGSTTSQGALLVVDSTPLILTQPTSVVVSPGAGVNFDVTADGPELTYQWWHGGAAVPGATTATLSLASAFAGAQGSYYAVVQNFAGATTSVVANLSFDATALNIIVPPKGLTVETGYPASFQVLVSGIPPFAYQWQYNGVPIAGATESTLTIAATTAQDSGSYSVVVTNGYRALTSALAQLTITPAATAPRLAVNRYANNITLTFSAEGGRTYRLLSSTDLAVWTPVATNVVVIAGPMQFIQPITPAPVVFFRVATP